MVMINWVEKDLIVVLVGVAYEIGKFFVGLDGEFGFTNVVDFKSDGVSNPKNMNFSIGVGYKF